MSRSTFTRACNDPDPASATTPESSGLHDDAQKPLNWMLIPNDAVAEMTFTRPQTIVPAELPMVNRFTHTY